MKVRTWANSQAKPVHATDFILNNYHCYIYMWSVITCHLFFPTENILTYEGWNFNSGNYLFTTDTK